MRSAPHIVRRCKPAAVASVAIAQRPGATVRVVGGTLAGVTGPGEIVMPLVVAHVTVEPGTGVNLEPGAGVGCGFETAGEPLTGVAARPR